MTRLKEIGRLSVVAAWLLGGGGALAQSQQVREELQCRHDCKSSLKQCTKVCEKHGGPSVAVCTRTCTAVQKECLDECKPAQGGAETSND